MSHERSESRLVSEKLPQPVLKAVEKAIDTISPYLSTPQEAHQLGVLLSEVAFAAFEAGRSTQSETEDSKRLDFAEQKGATIYCSDGGHWVFVDERVKDRRGILGASIRGCIDAAMKEIK